ncbi:hypothetical protein AB1Y20_022473 [Prymnesium parvum]|uniref:Uncharacterized protein n=1 Tax=Prymnesium parvum TaxID=97485 RepID=A0AB34JIY7_PRYPA
MREVGEDLISLVRTSKRASPEKHRFFWFKYSCCASWAIILAAFTMFVISLVCIGELGRIRHELCEEQELNTTLDSCRDLLYAYANCLETKNPLTSRDMRRCFLLQEHSTSAFRTYALSHRYENETVEYTTARNLLLEEERLESGGRRALQNAYLSDSPSLHQEYLPRSMYSFHPRVLWNDTVALQEYRENLSFPHGIEGNVQLAFVPMAYGCSGPLPPETARGLVRGTAGVVDFSQTPPGLLRLCVCHRERSFTSPASTSDDTCAEWAAPAGQAVEDEQAGVLAYLAVPEGPRGAALKALARGGDVTSRRKLQSPTVAQAEEALNSSYNLIAGASIIALIASGLLEYLYIWVTLFSLLGMVSSCLALYGLGNSAPRCLDNPKAPERMHKVSLRCSCHLGWIFGTVILLFSCLVITKYQVLLQYAQKEGYLTAIPSRWGVRNVWVAAVPCFLGIFVGLAPALSAMVLSRARAERREALESDLYLSIRRERKPNKMTGPRKMHVGPPPNPASLNPIFERV